MAKKDKKNTSNQPKEKNPGFKFPVGNEYYKLRSKDGRNRKFNNPDELLEAFNKYTDFCINTPLMQAVVQKIKVAKDREEIIIAQVPHIRAFTIKGFCNFIGIVESTLIEYEKIKEPDFSKVITHIRQIISNQKFEGAASGFYNSNIIARDLGLTEKTDMTSGGESLSAYLMPFKVKK